MTDTIDPDTIIDAIADDLAQLDLGDYLDWRKAPPTGLTGDNGPWLAVWIDRTVHTPLAVDGTELVYSDGHVIQVQWAEPTQDVATVTQGVPDSNAAAVLATAKRIQARLRSYAAAVPGLDGPNLEATLTTTDYAAVGDAITVTVTLTVGEIPA